MQRHETYFTAPYPTASAVLSSSSSVHSSALPGHKMKSIHDMTFRSKKLKSVISSPTKITYEWIVGKKLIFYWLHNRWSADNKCKDFLEATIILPLSIKTVLHRLLASSSKSTNLTVSVLRVRNRFPSSPKTSPNPTWLALGYLLSSAGSQPARLAAWKKIEGSGI